ncbi:MAG: metal ABC transporter ATP-binding protein [Ruminococcus sp.]|nr:metal ABC transporter ATP-binding protein [Ruminococcus sp.]
MSMQLSCENVTLGYEGTVVTQNLSFSVDSGSYLCIVGENGSGKSTLIKALLHLKAPVSGKITLGDGLKQKEIGYLPQQTIVQRDFPASVQEIVLSGCLNRCGLRPFYSRAEKKLAEKNMEKLRISELRNACYRFLSGGQQQRVLLARALCATQKMLLLDEPVTGLDPKAASEMYELVAKINREDGITVIMVSHDIGAAVRYATHILHLGQEPLFFGTKEDYLKSDIGRAFITTSGGDRHE